MSTELKRQAASIRKQQLDSLPLQKGRPSLFLSANEAAAVDVSTIHEAAVSGLSTLQQYDDRFETYFDTLLHPSSIELQRELKTAEENAKLDAELTDFLDLLSLFALEPSAHLVLEYLIRRYRIHEMNAHDLLQAMLIAHDHKIFARIVQLCKLTDSPWAFLHGVKQSGVPPPRSAIVQRAKQDPSILKILNDYVQAALDLTVRAVSNASSSSLGLEVIANGRAKKKSESSITLSDQVLKGVNHILSFYAAVVIELIELQPLDEDWLREMYLFLVEGLKNKYGDDAGRSNNSNGSNNNAVKLIVNQWRKACCMILAQLSVRTSLGMPFIRVMSSALAEALVKSDKYMTQTGVAVASGTAADPSVALTEIVTTVVILAQRGKFKFTSKVLQIIFETTSNDADDATRGQQSLTSSSSSSSSSSLLSRPLSGAFVALLTTLCELRNAFDVRMAVDGLAKAITGAMLSALPLRPTTTTTTTTTASTPAATTAPTTINSSGVKSKSSGKRGKKETEASSSSSAAAAAAGGESSAAISVTFSDSDQSVARQLARGLCRLLSFTEPSSSSSDNEEEEDLLVESSTVCAVLMAILQYGKQLYSIPTESSSLNTTIVIPDALVKVVQYIAQRYIVEFETTVAEANLLLGQTTAPFDNAADSSIVDPSRSDNAVAATTTTTTTTSSSTAPTATVGGGVMAFLGGIFSSTSSLDNHHHSYIATGAAGSVPSQKSSRMVGVGLLLSLRSALRPIRAQAMLVYAASDALLPPSSAGDVRDDDDNDVDNDDVDEYTSQEDKAALARAAAENLLDTTITDAAALCSWWTSSMLQRILPYLSSTEALSLLSTALSFWIDRMVDASLPATESTNAAVAADAKDVVRAIMAAICDSSVLELILTVTGAETLTSGSSSHDTHDIDTTTREDMGKVQSFENWEVFTHEESGGAGTNTMSNRDLLGVRWLFCTFTPITLGCYSHDTNLNNDSSNSNSPPAGSANTDADMAEFLVRTAAAILLQASSQLDTCLAAGALMLFRPLDEVIGGSKTSAGATKKKKASKSKQISTAAATGEAISDAVMSCLLTAAIGSFDDDGDDDDDDDDKSKLIDALMIDLVHRSVSSGRISSSSYAALYIVKALSSICESLDNAAAILPSNRRYLMYVELLCPLLLAEVKHVAYLSSLSKPIQYMELIVQEAIGKFMRLSAVSCSSSEEDRQQESEGAKKKARSKTTKKKGKEETIEEENVRSSDGDINLLSGSLKSTLSFQDLRVRVLVQLMTYPTAWTIRSVSECLQLQLQMTSSSSVDTTASAAEIHRWKPLFHIALAPVSSSSAAAAAAAVSRDSSIHSIAADDASIVQRIVGDPNNWYGALSKSPSFSSSVVAVNETAQASAFNFLAAKIRAITIRLQDNGNSSSQASGTVTKKSAAGRAAAKSVKPAEELLSAVDSQLLVLTLPILLRFCGHAHQPQRELGLLFARRLASLPPHAHLSLDASLLRLPSQESRSAALSSSSSSSSLSSFLHSSSQSDVRDDVVAICESILEHAAAIRIEPFTVSTVLATSVYPHPSRMRLLCALGVVYGWSHPIYATPIFAAAASFADATSSSSSLEETWTYVKQLTMTVSDANLGFPDLVQTLVLFARHAFRSSSPSLKDQIIDWFLECVDSSSPSTAAPSSAAAAAMTEAVLGLFGSHAETTTTNRLSSSSSSSSSFSLSTSQLAQLYEGLLREQLLRPGQSGVLSALQTIVELFAAARSPDTPADGTAASSMMLSMSLSFLSTELKSFQEQFDRAAADATVSAEDEGVDEVDEGAGSVPMSMVDADATGTPVDAAAGAGAGLSAPMQRMMSLLEALTAQLFVIVRAPDTILSNTPTLQPLLRSQEAQEEMGGYMGSMAALLLDFLKMLNDPVVKMVIMVDYCRSLAMETASIVLAYLVQTAASTPLLGPGAITPSTSASSSSNQNSGKKKSRKSVSVTGAASSSSSLSPSSSSMYTANRINSDIQLLLATITGTKASHVQTVALRLLKLLLQWSALSSAGSSASTGVTFDAILSNAIRALGKVLAMSSINMHSAGKQTLVEQILQTFVSFLPNKDDIKGPHKSTTASTSTSSVAVHRSASSNRLSQQHLLQSLCAHLYRMPQSRRTSLLKMALSSMQSRRQSKDSRNDVGAMVNVINILLAHSFVAHETAVAMENSTALAASARITPSSNDDSMQVDDDDDEERLERDPSSPLTASASPTVTSSILLSKASQRRAYRSRLTSVPEELFALALESMSAHLPAADAQLLAVIQLLSTARSLLQLAVSHNRTAEDGVADGDKDENDENEDENAAGIVHIQSCIDYCAHIMTLNVTGTTNTGVNVSGSGGSGGVATAFTRDPPHPVSAVTECRGYATTLSILHLEFVLEKLEHKPFHEALVVMLDDEGEGTATAATAMAAVQQRFVMFADQVLQLLATASALETGYGIISSSSSSSSSSSTAPTVELCIDGQLLRVAPSALGKRIASWCYDALGALQRLMDGPSFVSILQELMEHELPEVRQKALVMLGERLESMVTSAAGATAQGKHKKKKDQVLLKDEAEIDLYLDLNTHLRGVVENFLPVLSQLSRGISANTNSISAAASFHQKSALVQSAVMCNDVLARFLGKRLDWASELVETLQQLVTLADSICKLIIPSAISPDAANDNDGNENDPRKSKSKKKSKVPTAKDNGSNVSDDDIAQTVMQQAEYLKLMGSVSLCCGTICAVLGPKALASIPTIFDKQLSMLEYLANILEFTHHVREHSSKKQHLKNKREIAKSVAMRESSQLSLEQRGVLARARVLLIRSILSSIGTIVHELPTFTHSFLPQILTRALRLESLHTNSSSNNNKSQQMGEEEEEEEEVEGADGYGDSDGGGVMELIRGDVDRCLSVLATRIPSRLSIPLLLSSAAPLLRQGHHVASRLADLLSEIWQQMDRPTVVAHLGACSMLATLLLDYRRVFGESAVAASEDADAAAVEAVLELLLKLTETELKSFLVRLAEWRDVPTVSITTTSSEGKGKKKVNSNNANDSSSSQSLTELVTARQRYSRAVSYFSLTDSLMSKLKVLFVPMMGVLWSTCAEKLHLVASLVHKAAKAKLLLSTETTPAATAEMVEEEIAGSSGKKKNKKRKQLETEVAPSSATASDSVANQQDTAAAVTTMMIEMELLAGYILSSVRECCVHAEASFIDETRFEEMMLAVVGLIPTAKAFEREENYLTFMESYVGACLSALSLAAGKDLLWKPMNHKLLLLTRDKHRLVRIAAVTILHRLFSEIGEEYLILLPECLPFLSELMEDSHADVVSATSETIKFIEDLSGEKLDQYLQ